MREAVINRDGVLHYAICGDLDVLDGDWFIYCDPYTDYDYAREDVVRGRPTCVRCLGNEALRGKDLEPIEVPCR